MTTRREAIAALVGAGAIATMPDAVGVAFAEEKRMPKNRIGPIIQHGYVVEDAAKTAMEWIERIGIGPFYQFEQKIDNYVFRGKPVDLTMKTAIGYWQDIQIELIQQVSPAKTLYSEATLGKINHYAVMVPDIEAEVRALDAERYVAHRGGTQGALTFLYLDRYLPDGSHLELMQSAEVNLAAFEGMKAITRSWDGTKPLRTVQDLMADLTALAKAGGSAHQP